MTSSILGSILDLDTSEFLTPSKVKNLFKGWERTYLSGVFSISQSAYILIALISFRKTQQNFLIKHTASVGLLLK